MADIELTFTMSVQACLDCRGSILFTGIGKSGFIAQKVCQTLVSTGTKAVFLNPTDALHGDIGIVGQDDLVVIVSKSGATEELLRLVPYAKVGAPAPLALLFNWSAQVRKIPVVRPHVDSKCSCCT
jgi:D-arabinose 5-phosphate isomerase GutQ